LKRLKTLLNGVLYLEVIGSIESLINKIQFDVEQVNEKDIFFALIAYGIDGHQFINEAINKGTSVVVCEIFPEEINKSVTYLRVKNTLAALSLMAANYYGNPTRKLKMVGVTGTNGKTSTVTLLHQLFRKLGYNVGLLSTVTNKINDVDIPTNKTTPHATQIQSLCKRMVDENCEYCFMELSSHGIHQKRVEGIYFTGAVFTNITHDHLDYHGSFDEYFRVKKGFLDMLNPSSFLVSNMDDLNNAKMTADVKAILKTLSLKDRNSDFFCKVLTNSLSGLTIELEGKPIHLQLRAEYNAYNLLSVYAIAVLLGIDKSSVISLLPKLKPVEGRFDFLLSKNKVIGVVDYAHTPDALTNLFNTLIKLKTNRIITVIGCGGNRDKEKRPEMARTVYQHSDFLILTSDNPRLENPLQIIKEMLNGLEPNPADTKVILDRKEAIKYACSIAKSQDIILVAGKGHEKYQEIKNVKHPFDDKFILSEMLNYYFC